MPGRRPCGWLAITLEEVRMSPTSETIETQAEAVPTVDVSGSMILIVDDMAENLKVLRQTLEGEGFQILIATDGARALEVARTCQPDLILMDIQMPVMDGIEACRRMKADVEVREIPVVFVTGRAETESVIDGFKAGGVDYIVKPFRSEEVLIRVQTHLKIDRLHRELTAANLRIREAAERKARFLADMSHDIRTPITAILGYVDNMLDGVTGELSEQQRHYVGRIGENTDYTLTLIGDILSLSRIEAGRDDVRAESFSLKRLIASCCAMVKPLVQEGVELKQDVSDDVGEAVTDERKVQQVLVNLLSNAAKFTKSGSITVKAAIEPEFDPSPCVAISVVDTGIGIPAEAVEPVFDEFWQVETADGEKVGSGLGLAIARNLTQLLGGRIDVASAVREGSTFRVRIPVVYEPGRTVNPEGQHKADSAQQTA